MKAFSVHDNEKKSETQQQGKKVKIAICFTEKFADIDNSIFILFGLFCYCTSCTTLGIKKIYVFDFVGGVKLY